jgi:hypothetical protein
MTRDGRHVPLGLGVGGKPPAAVIERRAAFLHALYEEVSLDDWKQMVRTVVDKIKESGDAKLFSIMAGYMMGLPPRLEGDDKVEKTTLRIIVDGRVGVESTTETGRLSSAD